MLKQHAIDIAPYDKPPRACIPQAALCIYWWLLKAVSDHACRGTAGGVHATVGMSFKQSRTPHLKYPFVQMWPCPMVLGYLWLSCSLHVVQCTKIFPGALLCFGQLWVAAHCSMDTCAASLH